jgi:hypothetical protein
MRFLIFLSIALTSTAAISCPNLQGTYDCTDVGGGTDSITIQSFQHVGDFRSYMIGVHYVLADGETVVTKETPHSKTITTARCDSKDALMYTVKVSMPERLISSADYIITADSAGFKMSRIYTNYDPQDRPTVDQYFSVCKKR